MVTKIESSSNSVFKGAKKLLTPKERKKNRLFITEGYRSVADACLHKAPIEYIIVNENYSNECFDDKYKVYRLSNKLFDELSSTVNSQGIAAVVRFVDKDIDKLKENKLNRVVYLDSVMDPGNMGTILRTADAMGIDAVILSKGCVDIYNPKVVRSTMSSIFNVPVYFDDDSRSALSYLSESGFNIAGTFIDGSLPCFDADIKDKTVIVMGNEANGISDEVERKCNIRINIPMQGGAESLNVAVCCGMVLYEQMKQNIKTGGIKDV